MRLSSITPDPDLTPSYCANTKALQADVRNRTDSALHQTLVFVRTWTELIYQVTNLGERFLDFLDDAAYPCVGAKSALARGAIQTHEFDELGNHGNDRPMLDGLSKFVAMIEDDECDKDIVHSFVAIFNGPTSMNEHRFETQLWSQLSRIHELDGMAGHQAANDVSSDVDSPHFSLSVVEHPFFVIGLHPNASRLARRFSNPALVFNSHRQFEKLREDGRYWKIQAATRSRETELQGSINPNLADFGEESEARQYSGREVEADWRCPFDFSKTSNLSQTT